MASNIHISKTLADLKSNTARFHGGALCLEQNSKIYLLKNELEPTNNRIIMLNLSNNSADEGGAIYVADNSNIAVLCQAWELIQNLITV